MNYKILASFLASIVFAISSIAQNQVCLMIEANPFPNDPALSVFTKYVDVYGCGIYAEEGVSDEKTLHAAAVWAELIDNDEDGQVDDQPLLDALLDNTALIPIFEADENAAMNTFFDNYNGTGVSAILWQQEIDPSQTGHWGDDATVEEILHTINSVGHTNIYPDAFTYSPNSSLLTTAMDIARGGQFTSIPNSYPDEAWYHYDDGTCDYECMATEYLYWMIVSNMGILDDMQTCQGIANEWEPCSPELLESTDILGHGLITNPIYKLPLMAPDGNYCPIVDAINKSSQPNKLSVFPNPASGIAHMKLDRTSGLLPYSIQDIQGVECLKGMFDCATREVDVSKLPKGVYYLVIEGYEVQSVVVQ
ncbi:MAG: hypothetical protein ACI84C_001271 [Flavobacteriales bacterium]|jgi:hypothetical protein